MDDADIDITASSSVEAIEHLLQRATVSIPPANFQQEGFLLGYSVESSEFDDLVRDAIREIQTLAAEHTSLVIACEVSGFHGTDNGHRLWGTIECVLTESGGGDSTRVDGMRSSHAPSAEALTKAQNHRQETP